MPVINTNINASFAHTALAVNARSQTTAMQQLSTGKRINGAKDDAAGLAMSQEMTTKIRSLTMAVRSTNDAVSLLQTADGSLGQISSALQRIRELSVQAATDTVTLQDKIALNNEASAMVAEVDQVVASSTFSGQKLLDGTFTAKQFQIGADANSVMTVTIPSVTATTLGLSTSGLSVTASATVGSTALASGDLTINSVAIGAAATASAKDVAAAINLKTAQTGVTATPRATVANSVAAYVPIDQVIDLGSYGKLIAPVKVDGGKVYYYWDRSGDGTSNDSGTLNSGNDYIQHDVLDSIFNKDINGNTNNSVANVDGQFGTTDIYRYGTLNGVQLALPTIGGTSFPPYGANGVDAYQPPTSIGSTTATGANIAADGSNESNSTYNDLLAIWDAYNGTQNTGSWLNWGSGANGLPDGGTPPQWRNHNYWSATSSTLGHAGFANAGGYVYNYSDSTNDYVALEVLNPPSTFTAINSGEIQINGRSIGGIGTASSASARSAQMLIAINAETGNTGVTAAIDASTGGVKLTATDGRNIEISTLTSAAITGSQIGIALNGTASGSRTVTTIRSSVDLSSTGTTMTVASSGNGSTASGISAGGYSANGTPLVDLTSASGCQAAISLVDNAIKTVSSARASIGASESGLISIASNLDNTIMNLTESRSRILDTDYAVATTELSRSQIIAQASTAMLAQANLSAKDVLTLLKND